MIIKIFEFFTSLKMHFATNFLLKFICLSIVGTKFCLFMHSCDYGSMPNLSFNQIGQFIEYARDPFFKQIITNGRPTTVDGASDGREHWTELLGTKMVHIGVMVGTIRLISNINSRISDASQTIAALVRSEHCDGQLDEQMCQELLRETTARLKVRELFKMVKRIIKYKILNQFWRSRTLDTVNLCTWWYRFRYRVASRVKFVNGGTLSEIRPGITQYYRVIHGKFVKWVDKFDNDNAFLENVLQILDSNWTCLRFKLRPTSEEIATFDPATELSQDKPNTFAVLMHKPVENEVPVFVFCEKFPVPYKLGTCFQAIGFTHRGVKVYDIEFHFGEQEGIIIGNKIRKRADPEKGIKFKIVGWTKKSQWEVQNIFDQFNDFSMENGQFKEGKFSLTKYHLKENNCIDFSRAFVEALLEGDNGQLKVQSKHWPPTVLRQPSINSRSWGLPSCFTAEDMTHSDK